jgi:hypothetical protein
MLSSSTIPIPTECMRFGISFHFKVRKGEDGKSPRVKDHMCFPFLEDLLRKHVLVILLYTRTFCLVEF